METTMVQNKHKKTTLKQTFMKTKHTKLAFNKSALVELNDLELNLVHGGSTDVIRLTVEIATYGTWLTVL